MAKNSSVVADPVVDLEKGTVTLKEAGKEEEVAIVDPLKAKLIGFLTVTIPILASPVRHANLGSQILFYKSKCKIWELLTRSLHGLLFTVGPTV